MGIPDQGGFWDLFSVTESISDRVCRDQIGTSLPCTMLHSQCNILNVTINSVSYFYRPQRSCGKVMFLHLSVILFTGGWVSGRHPPPRQTLPLLGRHPPRQTPPPRADTNPPGRHLPLGGHPSPSRRPLQRTVRILLECTIASFNVFSSLLFKYIELHRYLLKRKPLFHTQRVSVRCTEHCS